MSSKLSIIYICQYISASALWSLSIIFLYVPYRNVLLQSIACILLPSLLLSAILFTSVVDMSCLLLEYLCCDICYISFSFKNLLYFSSSS